MHKAITCTVIRLSIVSPAPDYPGNSGDLAGTYPGIYRILCPHRPGTYPGDMQGDISIKRAGNLLYAEILTKGTQGYRAGTYPGIYKQNVPRSPGQ